jgi:hypothetical protein
MMYDPSATRSSMENSSSSETNNSLANAIFLTFDGSLSTLTFRVCMSVHLHTFK